MAFLSVLTAWAKTPPLMSFGLLRLRPLLPVQAALSVDSCFCTVNAFSKIFLAQKSVRLPRVIWN